MKAILSILMKVVALNDVLFCLLKGLCLTGMLDVKQAVLQVPMIAEIWVGAFSLLFIHLEDKV